MSGGGNEAHPSVISSLFGVVGRELQQFVLNAAGVNPVCHLGGPFMSQALNALCSHLHPQVRITQYQQHSMENARLQQQPDMNPS